MKKIYQTLVLASILATSVLPTLAVQPYQSGFLSMNLTNTVELSDEVPKQFATYKLINLFSGFQVDFTGTITLEVVVPVEAKDFVRAGESAVVNYVLGKTETPSGGVEMKIVRRSPLDIEAKYKMLITGRHSDGSLAFQGVAEDTFFVERSRRASRTLTRCIARERRRERARSGR